MQTRKKKKELICSRCGKVIKKGNLLESYDGKICVDCVVLEEMTGLESETHEDMPYY